MTKEIKIKGMMCPNCERHVKEALESLDGVSALVNYQKGVAIVTISNDQITDNNIIDAISKLGYEVKKIK